LLRGIPGQYSTSLYDESALTVPKDQPWSAQDERQIIGTVWRQRQTRDVHVIHLLAMGTADITLSDLASGKKTMFEAFTTPASQCKFERLISAKLQLTFDNYTTALAKIMAGEIDNEDEEEEPEVPSKGKKGKGKGKAKGKAKSSTRKSKAKVEEIIEEPTSIVEPKTNDRIVSPIRPVDLSAGDLPSSPCKPIQFEDGDAQMRNTSGYCSDTSGHQSQCSTHLTSEGM
jgi:hypothetical protein